MNSIKLGKLQATVKEKGRSEGRPVSCVCFCRGEVRTGGWGMCELSWGENMKWEQIRRRKWEQIGEEVTRAFNFVAVITREKQTEKLTIFGFSRNHGYGFFQDGTHTAFVNFILNKTPFRPVWHCDCNCFWLKFQFFFAF